MLDSLYFVRQSKSAQSAGGVQGGFRVGFFFKALFDRVAILLALPAVLPIMLLVALAIRIDSSGPILFRQPRFGKDGRTIIVHKFRTMAHDRTDLAGARQAGRGDDRVTRVGRVLRRTCLDELPQLWDVLCGRMALVGPRPHPIGMLVEGLPAEAAIPRYRDRWRMKPGLTGLAQVRGNRGPVTSLEMGRRRVELDNEYIEGWTFWRDLAILWQTVAVLSKDECY